jgi:uncharacterized protein (TIGR02466 family)
MQHVAELFPVPIVGFDLESINDDNISKIKNHILSLEFDNAGFTNGSLSREQQVLNNDIFKNVKEEILLHLSDYISYCNHNVEGIKIVSSWSNTVGKDEHIHAHWHENSYISGVIHLTGGSDLVIKKPLIKTFFKIDTEYKEHDELEFRISARRGQLVLFPSMLPHYVQHHEIEETRISVAFNTWPIKYGTPAAWVDLSQS